MPPGLSADEILQRVDFFAREEDFAAWIVWNEQRTTYVTPRGAREDGPPHFVGGMWMNWGLDPLAPVPDAETLASRTLPPHKEARRWLTGAWHVAYPDGFGGWTPAEDSTLDLRDDGTFVWEPSLPWFISGRDWLVHASNGVVDLSLHSRYYWCDNHLVVRDHRADGHPRGPGARARAATSSMP